MPETTNTNTQENAPKVDTSQSIRTDDLIFGDFLNPPPACKDTLTLNFCLSDEHRLQRWSSYGLSADFIGDYFSAFFPGTSLDGAPISQREEAKASVSFIANELIENAVKYGEHKDSQPIAITLRLYGSTILFEATNPAMPDNVDRYRAFVTRLLEGNPSEMYIQQLEHTAMGSGQSHMGILTMINDYGARFGWRFAPAATMGAVEADGGRHWLVSVMAHLSLGGNGVAT